MENGWIKLSRKLASWEWMDEPVMVFAWVRLLFLANWKETKWHGETIERGSFVTSLNDLAATLRLSVKKIRTILKRLKESGEIEIETAHNRTKITICKYDTYQDEGQRKGKERANEGQMKGKERATTEEYKENKEYKERKENSIKEADASSRAGSKKTISSIFQKPTVLDIQTYCAQRGNSIDPEAFFDKYEANGWKVGRSNAPMKDWKAAVRTWEKREGEFSQRGRRGADRKFFDADVKKYTEGI